MGTASDTHAHTVVQPCCHQDTIKVISSIHLHDGNCRLTILLYDASPSLQETCLSCPILRLPIRRRRRRSKQVHLLPPHRCSPRPMDIKDPSPILPPFSDSRLACVQASPRNSNSRLQEPALNQGPAQLFIRLPNLVRMLRRTHLAQACDIQASYIHQDHEHNLQAGSDFHVRQVHPETQLRCSRKRTHEQPLFSIIHVYATGTFNFGRVQRNYRRSAGNGTPSLPQSRRYRPHRRNRGDRQGHHRPCENVRTLARHQPRRLQSNHARGRLRPRQTLSPSPQG